MLHLIKYRRIFLMRNVSAYIFTYYFISGDLKKFYHTPVDTATPLETLRRMQLPKNLHVQYEYHRFHPGKPNISLIYHDTVFIILPCLYYLLNI